VIDTRICKPIIVPVALYGCETWSLILTEEHGLKAFEKNVVRGMSILKRDVIIGN
jgi:hypothetical protein